MREIGSEFWLEDNRNEKTNNTFQDLISFGEHQQLLFSGRTAIDYVLEDITKPINRVYMPSYCCDSMLQPFIDRNIDIEFYDVISGSEGLKYIINYDTDIDVFFASSYFGYGVTTMDPLIEEFKNRDIIVIEDITHRLLSEQNFCEKADYVVASLRKWFPIPSGGLAIKLNGFFKHIPLVSPSNDLLNKKINAMNRKAEFLKNSKGNNALSEVEKSTFLKLFSDFNIGLRSNYKYIKIDDFSIDLLSKIDILDIQKKRRENAQYIYEAFKKTNYIRFLITEPNYSKDCPLFIPILVRAEMRAALRKHFITHNTYCPVHWPIPKNCLLNDSTAQLYNEELSLVCDQRYIHDDIKRLIATLGDFIDLL